MTNRIELSNDKKLLGAAQSLSAQLFDLVSLKDDPVKNGNIYFKKVNIFDGYNNNVTSIGFQKDSKWVYTSSEDGSIKIHDRRSTGAQRCFTSKEPVN
jgi:G protein beta subunit-like protein